MVDVRAVGAMLVTGRGEVGTASLLAGINGISDLSRDSRIQIRSATSRKGGLEFYEAGH